MLDQNTDRMWYVIGAVLIGAAIIFGMNTLMPNAFASVSENFDSVLETIDINNRQRNLLSTTRLYDGWIKSERENALGLYENVPEGDIRVYIDKVSGSNESTHKHTGYIRVKPNTTYVFYGPEGLYAPRVGFYDKNKDVVGTTFNSIDENNTWGDIELGSIEQSIFTTPDDTVYMRVSAENTDYALARYGFVRGSHWSDWVLHEYIME